MSTRLASLAMDTNDIDCVYHIAYPEMIWGILRVRVVARYLELSTEVVLEPTSSFMSLIKDEQRLATEKNIWKNNLV
jgi:hypothetical protein